MGADLYRYWTSYEADLPLALERLRAREFAAGRYFPVLSFPWQATHAPGQEHGSIAAAREDAGASGTRSILDIDEIVEGDTPAAGKACGARAALVVSAFGTTRPSVEKIEDSLGATSRAARGAIVALVSPLVRGSALYIVAYENEEPVSILFMGYSHD